jgi:dethiobiotin synthetase
MQIFIAGTDTNIGKTIVSSWLCLHTGYSYFKPIQTGSINNTDSNFIKKLNINTYKESFVYKHPVSPHLAASLENQRININKIKIPKDKNLIIEGAGGLLVPINKNILLIDLIKKIKIPVILLAKSTLGTINHTLLSLEALRSRNINILGVILNNITKSNQDFKYNLQAIEFYGKTKVLACLPKLSKITMHALLKIKLPNTINKILK